MTNVQVKNQTVIYCDVKRTAERPNLQILLSEFVVRPSNLRTTEFTVSQMSLILTNN